MVVVWPVFVNAQYHKRTCWWVGPTFGLTSLRVLSLITFPDVDVDKPDEKSIMTYVAQFLKRHPDRKQSDSDARPEEEVTSCQIFVCLVMPGIFFPFLYPVCFIFCLYKCCSVSDVSHDVYMQHLFAFVKCWSMHCCLFPKYTLLLV